ncbi:MAG: hypothetical protein ACPG4K_13030 [Haloferula sp.]
MIDSAIEAVEDLGRKVVLGEHKVAIERMNPQWKKRIAARKGGIEKIEKQLEGIGAMMARNGLSIISFKTIGAPKVHQVWPGEGSTAENPNYTKWLLLIPTVTQLRVMDTTGDRPQARIINNYGFQVAIAEKEKLNWTFISGTDVKVSDLRSMFTSLPANMELPAVYREEVK